MPLEEVRGFRVVPLPLGRPDGFARFLFMRVHVDKSGVTQGRTLFVTNVGDDGAAALEAVFSTCGEIEAIELLRGGGDEARATSAAHVTFKSRAALRRALSLRPEAIASALGPPTARPSPADAMRSIVRAHFADRPPIEEQLREVDELVGAFEQEEAREEARRAAAARDMADGVADEDGFITVTYKKKRRHDDAEEGDDTASGAAATNGRRKKRKKNLELVNFYRFQMREAKRERLAALRQRFEEDKARIAKMKAARKFMPF